MTVAWAVLAATCWFWVPFLGLPLAAPGFALTAWLLARDLPGVLGRDRALQALFAGASLLWFAVALTFWFSAPKAVTGMAALSHLMFLWRRQRALPRSAVRTTTVPVSL